jgi:hypothetical protein
MSWLRRVYMSPGFLLGGGVGMLFYGPPWGQAVGLVYVLLALAWAKATDKEYAA